MMHFLALAVWAVLTLPAVAAEPPRLDLPIRCTPDSDCWLVNFVDHDADKGAKDFRCGRQTYDTHKGTDIAIASLATMARGVDVLAAAPGFVLGQRDGMRDVNVREIGGPKALKGKDCGNGVMLDHGFGWTTQYCHMRQGSVTVQRGDRVERGQKLGLVGLSGRTEFPHVHITVRRGKTVVDPFTGTDRAVPCTAGTAPLWSKSAAAQLTYRPARIYVAGFAARRPSGPEVRAGKFEDSQITTTSPAFIIWADTFWMDKGDKMQFRLTDPDGKRALDHTIDVKKNAARQMYYTGLKLKAKTGWTPGPWQADIRLFRGGQEIAHIKKTHVVR